ncbi:hypothetical protein ACET3Z_014316 [Daucus carota]
MMKRQEARTFLYSLRSPTLRRQPLQTNEDQGIGEKHFEVGSVYEVDHLNLPTKAPVRLKSIRVVMVTEKTELTVTVRYPSIGCLCNYLSHNKMSSADIYASLDEGFVMVTYSAGKVLSRQISAQEFDDNNCFEGFWQGDSSTIHPQSSTSFVKGSKEKLEHESDEDDKKAVKRKLYWLRDTDGAFSTAATKGHFLPSTVKRETASAWECIGSRRCSNECFCCEMHS